MSNAQFTVKNSHQEIVVVKGSIPKSLKLHFKILCVQKEIEMSQVLEDLIIQWIQGIVSDAESEDDVYNEEFEDVKAYVPKSLKLQFKLLCTQKRRKIRCVLYGLVKHWVDNNQS